MTTSTNCFKWIISFNFCNNLQDRNVQYPHFKDKEARFRKKATYPMSYQVVNDQART